MRLRSETDPLARPRRAGRPSGSARNARSWKVRTLVALAVKDLIDAGVHFGHRVSRWNPKMKPYIYGKRNLIHIIDLKETVRGLLRATKFFHRVAASNGLILFVGTKRQAAETLVEECNRCGMPYVTERWLGVKRLADAIIEGKSAAPAEPPPRESEASMPGGGRGDRRGDRRGGGGGGGPGGGRGGPGGGNVSRSGVRAGGRGPEAGTVAPV